jgi:hypothetical protein
MLINYFLMLTMLLLVSGLALDAGLLGWRQIRLQNAADAAAQEGMYQLARGDSAWATEGQAQAAANGVTNGASGVIVTLSNPPTTGKYANDTSAIRATVSQTVNNIFMALINAGQSTVSATAVAREIPTCIWIMNPNSSSNGSLWLLSAAIYASCGVFVNTASGYSLGVDGYSTLADWRTRVVGPSSTGVLSSGTISPSAHYSSASKTDPLAYITAPTPFTCTYTSATTISGQTTTLSPSNFCGGLTITNSTLTLQPGTYIIADGLTISNSSIFGLSGVTFFLTKHNSASYINTSINSSNLFLKAPTSSANGGITGVVVFADRNWVAHGSQGVSLANSTVQSDGIWYIPNTGLYLWSCTFSYFAYDVWYLDNLYDYGTTAIFNSNYSGLGGVSPLQYEDGVLVQ